MKTWKRFSVGAVVVLLLGIFSCEDPNAAGSSFTVTVSGTVANKNGATLDSVTIFLANPARTDTTKSDGSFNYTFTSTEKNDVSTTMLFRRINRDFFDTLYPVTYGQTQKTIALGEVVMRGKTSAQDSLTPDLPSARPGVIAFRGTTFQTISVRGAGANDATNLTFEVRDSLGVPVDALNKTTVFFSLLTKPDNLAYLNKTTAQTNADGQAIVQLTAGNKSGLAQVQSYSLVKRASDTTQTDTIKSPIVSITIAGGLPAESRFTMGAEKYNIPGGVILNYRDKITAVVGDTFGNPVQKGTKVYFTTTGGVVQPVAETNEDGIASVELITGNPMPPSGFATVTAQIGTPGAAGSPDIGVDKNQKIDADIIVKSLRKGKNVSKETKSSKTGLAAAPIFQKSITILFSSRASVTFNDTTFTVPVGASQEIVYRVRDLNGNPLTSGSTISVKAEPSNVVDLDGDKDVTIPDTFDPSFTQFRVRLTDRRTTGLSQGVPVTVTVNVASQNGDAKNSLSGFVLGTGGVTIDSSQVGRISLVNPVADTLYVSGGGVANSKDVEFMVYNIFGLPARNVPVTFVITKTVGGGEYVTPASGMTDSQGKVTTSVVSGIQYGIIHVQAQAKRDTLTISSDPKIFHIKVPPGTRLASQVSFLSISSSDIDIAGVGGNENSTISYVVKDSFGIPIDKERRAFAQFNMRFEPASVGGGTEPVLLPSVDSTDDNGKLTTRVVSGTQAGVVTVEVIINLPGRPAVKSLPVKITIHAGFADRGHFTLIPGRYVFPGNVFEVQPSFTVVVGDTFSNPVDKGTAVLFSSQAGVIRTGSDDFNAYTDISGIASVSLIPVNPLPTDAGTVLAGRPTFDTSQSNGRRGYHWVYARTQGKYGPVKDSVLVVQAFGPITVTGIPTSIVMVDDTTHQSAPINITVKDVYGNPLPDGTTITATVVPPSDPPTGFLVTTSGDIPKTLPNKAYARFPGSGITDFTFRVVDASTSTFSGISVVVNVTISSPNLDTRQYSFSALLE